MAVGTFDTLMAGPKSGPAGRATQQVNIHPAQAQIFKPSQLAQQRQPAQAPVQQPHLNFFQRNAQNIGGIGGGIVGGILGGPAGAVAGAAAGAGLGEASKRGYEGKDQVTNNKSDLVNAVKSAATPQALKAEGTQAAEAGGATLVGEKLLGPLVGKVASKLAGAGEGVAKAAAEPLAGFLETAAKSEPTLTGLAPIERSGIIRNLPGDVQTFAKLGVKTPEQLAAASDMVTGQHGWLSSLTQRFVGSGGPVDVGKATEAASEAVKNIADTSVKKMVQDRLGEVTSLLGQSDAKAPLGDVPGKNVFGAMQKAEAIMKGLGGTEDNQVLRAALNTVHGALDKALTKSAGADAVAQGFKFGPEEAKAIMDEATQKGIPKVGQFIVDTGNNVEKVAENRSAQAPFVRAGKALEAATKSGIDQTSTLRSSLQPGGSSLFRTIGGAVQRVIGKTVTSLADTGAGRAAGAVAGGVGSVLEKVAPVSGAVGGALQAVKSDIPGALQSASTSLENSKLPLASYTAHPLGSLIGATEHLIPRGGTGIETQGLTQPSQNVEDFIKQSGGQTLPAGAITALTSYRDSLAGLNGLANSLNGHGSYAGANSAVTASAPTIAKALGMGTNAADLTNVLHLMPSATDNPHVAQAKLQNLKDLIDKHAEQALTKEVSSSAQFGGLDQVLQPAGAQ